MDREPENIAQTLARELPRPVLLHTDAGAAAPDQVNYLALPNGFKLEKVDTEPLLSHPRRTKATAKLTTPADFVAYVNRHAETGSVVWCAFNPQTFALSFKAVIDEHEKATAGWRAHQASFVPMMSAEWQAWTAKDCKPMAQLEFAEFLEKNEDDITSLEGFPTSLEMMAMATEFSLNSEKRIKSVVRLQGGGFRLEAVDDDDANTLTQMKAFEKFMVGIPVFWGADLALRMTARLKYRQNGAKVAFNYDLIRPDLVHETAAKALIDQVRAGIGEVPLLMGSCD